MPEKTINHWLPEAHYRLLATWTYFESFLHTDSKISVESVSGVYVDRFVSFHENVLGQKIGKPLKEHIDIFGRFMAFIGILNGEVVVIQRFRIYHEYDDSHNSILEAYIGVDPNYYGRGYGTILRKITKQYVLSQSRVTALFSEVDADNVASRQSLEKAGFQYAGSPINKNNRMLYSASLLTNAAS